MKKVILTIILLTTILFGFFVMQDSAGRIFASSKASVMENMDMEGMGCENGACEAMTMDCSSHCISVVQNFSAVPALSVSASLLILLSLLVVFKFANLESSLKFQNQIFVLPTLRRLARVPVRLE